MVGVSPVCILFWNVSELCSSLECKRALLFFRMLASIALPGFPNVAGWWSDRC